MRFASLRARLIAALGFGLLYVPLGALVLSSFGLPRSGPTWEWYRRALTHPEILAALGRSLGIGSAAALASMALGTAAAYALDRGRFRGRRLFRLVTWVPFVLPEIVMAISLLIWFRWLGIALGTVSILLAHVTFTLSYVILTVAARLEGLDRSLEEAARDLGASSAMAFWRITFPLVLPGVVSGGALAFILSFDDFLISYFTAGPGSDTLPIKIYSMIRFGISPEVSALSTVLLAVTLAVILGVRIKPEVQGS